MKKPVLKIAAALFLTSFALGACSGDGPSADGESPQVANSPHSGGGDSAAPMPTNVPPGLLECGSPLDAEDGYHLIDADLTQAEWKLPSDWEITHFYEEENPVEKVETIWTAEPAVDAVSLNVINVVIYSGIQWGEVEDECGRVPVSAISDRLDRYNQQIGAEITKEAEFIEFAGAPAITQDVELEKYSYTGVWLFSRTHLLHTYCQWTTQEDLVRQGCEALYDSLNVPIE